MAGVNKVILVGHLGRDPEIRYTPSGMVVANFTMATTEKWKDKDGSKQDKVEWHKIVAFGKLAETCGEYLKKGKQVYVEGKIQTRSWEDNGGVKKYVTEIAAGVMQMLGSPKDVGEAVKETALVEEPPVPEDNDVPF